jgi:hypothetical protein
LTAVVGWNRWTHVPSRVEVGVRLAVLTITTRLPDVSNNNRNLGWYTPLRRSIMVVDDLIVSLVDDVLVVVVVVLLLLLRLLLLLLLLLLMEDSYLELSRLLLEEVGFFQ